MSPRRFRVLITDVAIQHLTAIAAWWAVNRTAAADLFISELEQCLGRLAVLPRSGAVYAHETVKGVRRLLLRRCGYHVYFTVDEAAGSVTIRALWHAARGGGPALM